MPFICKSNVGLTTSTHGGTMFRNKLEKWQGMDSFYRHCVGNNFLTVKQHMCSSASLVWIRMSCFFLCVGGWVSICGCVKMCYHYSSKFQDQSSPTLSPCHVNLDVMHYQTFQIENTLYLKVLRFWTVPWKR